MSWIVPRVIRGNRGDIASRYRILAELETIGVSVTAVFATRASHVPPSMRDRILPYGAVYNLWPRAAGIAALRASSVVVWTGGLDLQDDSSLLKLLHTWIVFASYRFLGLRILLAMQGAGPLTTRPGRWLAARVLSLVELALVRDRQTYALLAGLMPKSRLRLAADGIFLGTLESSATSDTSEKNSVPAPAVLIRNDARGPVIGLNVRLWFHFVNSWVPYHLARDRYLTRAEAPMRELIGTLISLIRHLREHWQARVVLISMYEPGVEPWEDDQPWLDRIKDAFVDDAEVRSVTEDLPIVDLARLMGSLDLMIGTRLHSTLIALREGVPAVHISYTNKGTAIYADLGLEDWVIDIAEVLRSPAALIALADRVLSDAGAQQRVHTVVERAVCANNEQLRAAVAGLGGEVGRCAA
jgi:polysaccharide pyruvyl transferase WcaK-like protein